LSNKVLSAFNKWTKPIKKAQGFCLRAPIKLEEGSAMVIFKGDVPMQMTTVQNELRHKFNMLCRASAHINSAGLNSILSNMEILAFGISWFGLVSGMFQFADPKDIAAFPATEQIAFWGERVGK
jgi:hypothetical protein